MLKLLTNYDKLTDEELILRCAREERRAFDALYERFSRPLFAYFYRMLWQDKALSEDMVQELFIRIYRHASSFDAARSASTWIYSVAHNLCKNQYRKTEHESRYQRSLGSDEATAPASNPDLKGFVNGVQEVLDQWPAEKKELFVLRFREQLTVPQIGEILEIPEGTVKSRLHGLQKELRERLSAYKHVI